MEARRSSAICTNALRPEFEPRWQMYNYDYLWTNVDILSILHYCTCQYNMFTAVFKVEFVKFNTNAAMHSMLGKYVTRKEIRLNKVTHEQQVSMFISILNKCSAVKTDKTEKNKKTRLFVTIKNKFRGLWIWWTRVKRETRHSCLKKRNQTETELNWIEIR